MVTDESQFKSPNLHVGGSSERGAPGLGGHASETNGARATRGDFQREPKSRRNRHGKGQGRYLTSTSGVGYKVPGRSSGSIDSVGSLSVVGF